MTSGLELCAYSLWQTAALARHGLRQGNSATVAECLHALDQIRGYAKRDSLARCAASTLAGLRRDARFYLGRVPTRNTDPVTRFP